MAKKNPADNPDSWRNLSSTERWAIVWILILVTALATANVLSVDVEGPSTKGGIAPRMLSLLFNYETDRVHIVSQPLLWLARLLLVAVVATVVISVRARKARLSPPAHVDGPRQDGEKQ